MSYSRTAGTVSQVRGVRKATAEVRNANAVLTSDAELTLTNVLPGTYKLEALLIYDASIVADIRVGWTVPAGATLDWTLDALTTGATATSVTNLVGRGALDAAALGFGGGTNVAGKVIAKPMGILVVPTAGTLTLRWAQQASDPTDITVHAGSALILTKIA